MGRVLAQRVVVAAAIFAAALGGCSRWAKEPRFGSLRANARVERFAYDLRSFAMPNGLRVALVDDPRTPRVTIGVRYLVGTADDPVDRIGLAHLAEHASFLIADAPGGLALGDRLTGLALAHNAWTTADHTHYAAVVAAGDLEAVLALEARRMTAACDRIDDDAFARERDVVLAEHMQRATPLDGMLGELQAAIYGAGHPYARAIDAARIAGASKDEVCALIAARYVPGQAILVITGALPADARLAIARTLGAVPRRAAPAPVAIAPARLAGISRHAAPVSWPAAVVTWPEPTLGTPGSGAYAVVRERLEGELAAAARDRAWIAGTGVLELGGPRAPVLAAVIEVVDAGDLEAAQREVAARMKDVLSSLRDEVYGGLEPRSLAPLVAWDDDATRAPWIADVVQYGDPSWFLQADLLAGDGRAWQDEIHAITDALAPGRAHVALITPAAARTDAAIVSPAPAHLHDLVPWRAGADPAEADRPLAVTVPAGTVERYQLANGLMVALAPDAHSPLVDARVVFPVGTGHERNARPGVATAAAMLLRPDRDGYYPPHVFLRVLYATTRGTLLGTSVDELTTTFEARGLAAWADWHVWYLSWLIDQGLYNPSDLTRIHHFARDERAREDVHQRDRTVGQALRARLYGAAHPYAQPPMSIADALAELDAADLARWRDAHYRAPGATLIVSGGFDPVAMRAEIAELFGPWSDTPPVALPAIPPAAPPPGPAWLAIDAERAAQVELTLGFAARSHPLRDGAARLVLAAMLEDRLRDVREGMGASYGVDVIYADAGAGATLLVHGNLDEGHAGAALGRVLEAVTALRDGAAEDRAGFVRARRRAAAVAQVRRTGAIAAAAHLTDLAALGADPDHDRALIEAVAAVTPAAVGAIAAGDLAAERMVVQLRGRPAIVDAAFAALGVTATR